MKRKVAEAISIYTKTVVNRGVKGKSTTPERWKAFSPTGVDLQALKLFCAFSVHQEQNRGSSRKTGNFLTNSQNYCFPSRPTTPAMLAAADSRAILCFSTPVGFDRTARGMLYFSSPPSLLQPRTADRSRPTSAGIHARGELSWRFLRRMHSPAPASIMHAQAVARKSSHAATV